MFRNVPAAVSHHRALLLSAAAALYPLIFATFLLVEKPGLGVGHFYYIPIALVALANGPAWGAGAGIASTGFYTLGIVISPRLPTYDVLTASSSIRLFTYTMVGVLVGWFAHEPPGARRPAPCGRASATSSPASSTRARSTPLSQPDSSRGSRSGSMLGDMDNIKDVNDTEGHAVGNDVLRRAGEILTKELGEHDQVARIGGDEFAVITSLPGTDAVRALCSRLTAALGAEGMSMSFGWAVCPRDGDSSLLLYRAADERLYAQKLIRSRFTAAEVVSMPTRAERLVMRSNLG